MNDPAARAELEKLARILDTDTASLAFLDYLETDQLRTLRVGITDALFEKFRASFSGFARLSSLLPLTISAKISQRVLGPMLSGRIAGEMPPERAIELSSRLSDAFLADTCLELDPERAQPIIAGFPVARSVAITRLLLARGEYITMGRFVDVLPDETLFAATDAIDSGADLLKISFFVEDSQRLDAVIAHLDTERRRAVIDSAAAEDLWPEVIATLRRIGPEARHALAELALAQRAEILDSLIRAAAEHDLWPSLLTIGRELPDASVERLADQPAFDDARVVRSVIDSVVANDLWDALQTQLPLMGPTRCARLLEVAAGERRAFLAEFGQRVTAEDACADTLRAGSAHLATAVRAEAAAASGHTTLAALIAEPAPG